jgi:hypothetical protein
MAKAGYVATAAAAVALVAATAKTTIGVQSPAQFGCDLQGFSFVFDGVTAGNVIVSCELCRATFATNAPGTNSTTITIAQEYGPTIVAGFTAASAWTAGNEPTVLTPIWRFGLDPNKGFILIERPPGRSWDTPVSNGLALRMNAPNAVNVTPTMFFERT